MKGVERAIANLNSLDRRILPQATVWAINRTAQSAISKATRKVASETVAGDNRVQGLPLKLVRGRVKLWKASARFDVAKQRAYMRINRGDLPAIKLGIAQTRPSRRKGKMHRGHSTLKVGRYVFRDAFVQKLANGRWHVMRRLPEAQYATGRTPSGRTRRGSYPMAVVKISLAGPLTKAFEAEKMRIIRETMPKELESALKQQIRLYFTRRI